MTVPEYILDGLAEALQLERELGVREFEFESAPPVEVKPPAAKPPAAPRQQPPRAATPASPPPKPTQPPPPPVPIREAPPRPAPAVQTAGVLLDFAFIHDRPLSTDGAEMLSKIVSALGKTAETAPLVLDRPFPRAKAYVVLGGLAMRKFFPAVKGAPGKWFTTDFGGNFLVTYSPEYILRFREVTPAVRKMKEDMWRSLKSVQQRTRQ